MGTERLVALKLAKAGYGTQEEILARRVDLVLDALEYQAFCADYENTYADLNRPKER